MLRLSLRTHILYIYASVELTLSTLNMKGYGAITTPGYLSLKGKSFHLQSPPVVSVFIAKKFQLLLRL